MSSTHEECGRGEVVHRRAAGSCSCRPWSVCEPGRARRGTGAGSGGAWPHWWLFMAISTGADAVPINLILLGAALCQGPLQRSHFPGYLRHQPAQSSYTLMPLQLPGPRSPRPAERRRRRRRRLGTGLSQGLLGLPLRWACTQRVAWARAGRLFVMIPAATTAAISTAASVRADSTSASARS